MTFESFFVNSLNCIDVGSGTFTVPVEGIYELSFDFHNYDGAKIILEKNGELLSEQFSFHSGNNYLENLKPTWMVSLNYGDKIRLKVVQGKIYTDIDWYRIFNGRLLDLHLLEESIVFSSSYSQLQKSQKSSQSSQNIFWFSSILKVFSSNYSQSFIKGNFYKVVLKNFAVYLI